MENGEPVVEPSPAPLFPRLQALRDTLPAPARDTRARIALELLFGAVVPPVLFHLELHWLPDFEPNLGSVIWFRPYEPVMALACVAAFLGWYPTRNSPTWLQAVAAGPLLLGAAFAGGLALLLSPLSFIGMLAAGIGVLGFLPFVTAAVFADCGFRAVASARRCLPTGPVLALALLSATTFAGGCLGAARLVRIVELRETAVLAGDRDGNDSVAESRLRTLYWFPGVDLNSLRKEGSRPPDGGEVRSPAAAKAYFRITGTPAQQEFND